MKKKENREFFGLGRKVEVAILNQLAKEADMRKWHLDRHLMEVREESMEIWEEELSSRGNSQCKGPEVGTSPGCTRAEEASMRTREGKARKVIGT